MTAPTPSPEEFADQVCGVLYDGWTPERRTEVLALIAARDAALLAPLREEVERLREALRDLLQHVPDSLPHGNASKWVLDHAAVTAARALAEGSGDPSQKL